MSRWLSRYVQTFSLGVLILAILVGIPYASIRYVGWPLPTSMPDRHTLYDWIEHPITPERSWAVLSIVGWILWAGMVYVLVDEILARLGRFRRLPRLRLASPIQGLAAGLVGATAITAPVAASTAPAPPSPAVPDTDPTAAPQPTGPLPPPRSRLNRPTSSSTATGCPPSPPGSWPTPTPTRPSKRSTRS